MEDMLRVGVITATHGLKGEMKVYPTTDDPKRYDDLKEVVLATKRGNLDLTVERVKYFKQFVIVKFKDYDSIDDIQGFIKQDIYVTRDNAVALDEGEFFICDLVGLDVVDENDEKLGTLKDIMQTGANDVYVVTMEDGKEFLIPSIPQCILEKNPEGGYIRVHLLEGLLDL
jgi:16S rRNA processing protein RimM